MSKYEELSKAELYRKERKERLAKESKKNAKRNAKTAKMKRILIRVVAVVAAIAIVASATIAIVNSTGSLFFRPAIAKVGDTKITTSEFQYYYRTSHSSLVQTAMQTDQQYGAGYYAQYQGFDYTKTPADQPFPNDKLPAEEGVTYATWDDYLTEETISAIQYLYAMEAEAKKAGVSLTEEESAAITNQIEQMRTSATQNGATLNAYLKMTYGSGINEKNVTAWMMRDALAQKYSQMKGEELSNNITIEAINAEFDANKQLYMYTDLRLYLFDVETGEIKEGTSQSEAEKIQNEAADKAKTEADDFLKNIKTEEDFLKAAEALDLAEEEEHKKEEGHQDHELTPVEESTDFPKAQYTVLEQAFGEEEAKWLMDEARKTGDKKVIAYEENGVLKNYYAIFVVKPAYRDDSLGNNFKAYEFAYKSSSAATSTPSDEDKKATKEKAEGLLEHWNGHDAESGTADTFAQLLSHVYPEDATAIQCGDYKDYTIGNLPDEVEEWATSKDRKHNDVAVIETETACYVVYFDSRNEEATWQKNVKATLGQNAYTEFEEALTAKPEYALTKDGTFMSTALKMKKSKINKDIEKYLYLMQQSQSAQSYMSY